MTSAASAPPPPANKLRFYNKIYRSMIGVVDPHIPAKLRPLWMHPAGPKTIFFWSPLVKWGLVIAGLSDLARPASSLSMQQCGALAATGIIWSRYSLVIIPKNYSLFAVNLFVGLTQCVQMGRAYMYQREQQQLQQQGQGQEAAAVADTKAITQN